MVKNFLSLFILLMLACSCRQKEHKPITVSKASQRSHPVAGAPYSYDTTLVLFNDTACKAHIMLKEYVGIDTGNRPNICLSFISNGHVIFKDSLDCNPAIFRFEFKDMNNDGVKDLLLLQSSSARSTEFFHLYVIDDHHKNLIRINGFEEIPNADLDTANNIITGSALWGQSETTSFYRIDNNKLIDLGYRYDHKIDITDR